MCEWMHFTPSEMEFLAANFNISQLITNGIRLFAWSQTHTHTIWHIWYGIEIDFYEKKSKMNFRKKFLPIKIVYTNIQIHIRVCMHILVYMGISYKCGGFLVTEMRGRGAARRRGGKKYEEKSNKTVILSSLIIWCRLYLVWHSENLNDSRGNCFFTAAVTTTSTSTQK